jgi:cation diffusion facilitator CzcD-associated flavoprotein CzcO
MEPERRVIVIGAGPAGIASALALKDAGMTPVVLDQADRVASSWRSRYDGLRLNTWRRFSHLPGRPFPKGTRPSPAAIRWSSTSSATPARTGSSFAWARASSGSSAPAESGRFRRAPGCADPLS